MDRVPLNLSEKMLQMEGHVLIVEDDEMLQTYLALHLRDNGCRVSVAGTAQEALFIFVDEEIDLVLLDLGLPDRDGFDLVELIRKKSHVPIVILTARSGKIDELIGFGVGANEYLTKPVDSQELVLRIRNLLDPASADAARRFKA